MPLLGSVAAKATDALVAELLRAWGLDKARRKLERHMAAIQCILLDADVKSRTNPAVRRWIKDLKTAAYQADDVLDDFRYEALRRPAAQLRRCSTACKVLSYFTINSPIVFRLHMGWKMKDALETIDELVVEMNNFQFLQHTEAPDIVHPQTHSHVDESEFVGKTDEKEQVVKILLDHSHSNRNNNNVVVLPIVGMGGIGKTTLAQLVHNDQRVANHFELVIWVCVSGKFVMKEIIRSIIQVAKFVLPEMESLREKLSEVLGNKRYLLVLDDVWNEDRQKWDAVRSLLCNCGGSGSAIIVTSRSYQVAFIMGTLHPHQISLMDEDQSWELFHRNTFERGVEKQEELISMAKSIVYNCKGLPLAIKTMATLLSSKRHSQWVSVLDSDVWKNDFLATGIVPALQLSYDHLSSDAKMSFSFCAIFPKDSPMDRDMLIQLWMANEFIASETRGREIFDLLVWRCFLQLYVEIQENPPSNFRLPYYDEYKDNDEFIHRPTTCKMHDLMHDLANSVSGNDCSILQESSSRQESLQGPRDASLLHHEVRHLSVDYVSNNNIAAMKGILAPRPRTILVQKGRMAKTKFISLRALKTYSIKTHMTILKHLRYLDCSYSDIRALPEATTMLYSLQTLKLIGCEYLKNLPEGIRYMSSLRHIFLDGCNRLGHMPQGIGQMNSLLTLTHYVIDSDAGRGIDQLKDLNIGGALSLTGLTNVHSAENAKQGNMSAKHNLKRLSLNWFGTYISNHGDEVDINPEEILEALHPHKRLEALQLSNYIGVKFSSWMHNSALLEHLTELSLTGCNNCKDLPPLWHLPFLEYLSLQDLHSLTTICVGNDNICNGESCISPTPFFPKLETIMVSNMPKLQRWHQEVVGEVRVVFPQGKKLHICRCPRLASMPEMLPLLEDLLVEEARDILLYHLIELSVQSSLECKGSIVVEHDGWLPMDLHFSRLSDSDVTLRLRHLTENVECFEEKLNKIPCRFIKKLDIEFCDRLFSPEPSLIELNIWNHFGFVENMYIGGNKSMTQWPALHLKRLRVLHLFDCSNLTGSLPSTISDEESVPHPRLEVLKIMLCNNLVEIPKLPASLERLHIIATRKLVTFPTIIGNIKKLRELSLIGCRSLMTFPDGMYGVTALKQLRMEQCPRLETLPEGLLQQLPALETLCIRNCRNLVGAFSQEGA